MELLPLAGCPDRMPLSRVSAGDETGHVAVPMQEIELEATLRVEAVSDARVGLYVLLYWIVQLDRAKLGLPGEGAHSK